MNKLKKGAFIFYIVACINLVLFIFLLLKTEGFSSSDLQLSKVFSLIFLINTVLFFTIASALNKVFHEVHDQIDSLKLRVLKIEKSHDGELIDLK